jgi:hypothetical protein
MEVAKEQACKWNASFWKRRVKKALPLTSDSSSVILKSKGCKVYIKYKFTQSPYIWENVCLLDIPGIAIPFQTQKKKSLVFQTLPDLLWGLPSLLSIGMGTLPSTGTEDRELNHSPLLSPEIKRVCKWRYGSTFPCKFTVWTRTNSPLPQPYLKLQAHIQCT